MNAGPFRDLPRQQSRLVVQGDAHESEPILSLLKTPFFLPLLLVSPPAGRFSSTTAVFIPLLLTLRGPSRSRRLRFGGRQLVGLAC